MNTFGHGPQAFGYSVGRFAFTDKRICSRREGGLLTSIQMANQYDHQRPRTSLTQNRQGCVLRTGWQQGPVDQQHFGMNRGSLRQRAFPFGSLSNHLKMEVY